MIVKIRFWIENYSGEECNDPLNDSQGSPSKQNLDYVSASLKVAFTLPSPELMKVVRMFIKHSHYFANLSQQGSMFMPASMKVDIFASRANKNILLAFLARSIDHWPYDASFRFVLETWLSYIQPWRYLNVNESEDDGSQKLDTAKFSSFISENLMFYSKLLSKVLNRFQRLEVGSPKNAYMIFRVFKVFSQDNLFPCLKSIACNQGYNLNQTQNVKRHDNIFSEEFKELMSGLMVAVLKSIEVEKKRYKPSENITKTPSPNFLTSLMDFINGGTTSTVADTEKQESEKVIQHLKFVSEKMASLFDLNHIVDQFQITLETARKDSIDESDFQSIPLVELSPEQRKGILNKKFKPDTQYRGHPDLLPIRSDEIGFLVRLMYQLSCWINSKWSEKIEDTYYRTDFVGLLFREVAATPATYMASVDHVDSSLNHSTLYGVVKHLKKLPPRITLRYFGSSMFATYLMAYLFLMVILLGNSSLSAVIMLIIGYAGFLVSKALINPTDITTQELKSNDAGTLMSESF